ncbi:MAG TPA: MFS transporter [Afifellaceae bacterium]|nr:MFS transporter [Afifellaceae bacterium]
MMSVTRWGRVALYVFAGYVAAFQVGKAAIAVPLLRRDLGLDLAAASWIIGAYGTLGALAGLAAGLIVSRIDPRSSVLAGLAAVALGSGLGALAPGFATLLAARVVEGCGFLAIVIAVPALVTGATAERDRGFAFALWGTYMPGGTAIIMLLAPALLAGGWRGLWLANALLAGAAAGVVWLATGADGKRSRAPAGRLGDDLRTVLARPGPILLALAFGLYAVQYFALTGLLPSLLVDRMGLSIAAAGLLSAAVVAANALGNLVAGLLMRRGVPLWKIAAGAFAFVGIAATGIFAEGWPVGIVAGLAALSLAVTGLVPATIFAAAPRVSPAPQLLGITMGLIVQATNLGQLVGPAALGGWVEAFGWSAAPALFGLVALAGLAAAAALRRHVAGS